MGEGKKGTLKMVGVKDKQNRFYSETLFNKLFSLLQPVQRKFSGIYIYITYIFIFLSLNNFSSIYIKQIMLEVRVLEWVISVETSHGGFLFHNMNLSFYFVF